MLKVWWFPFAWRITNYMYTIISKSKEKPKIKKKSRYVSYRYKPKIVKAGFRKFLVYWGPAKLVIKDREVTIYQGERFVDIKTAKDCT